MNDEPTTAKLVQGPKGWWVRLVPPTDEGPKYRRNKWVVEAGQGQLAGPR